MPRQPTCSPPPPLPMEMPRQPTSSPPPLLPSPSAPPCLPLKTRPNAPDGCAPATPKLRLPPALCSTWVVAKEARGLAMWRRTTALRTTSLSEVQFVYNPLEFAALNALHHERYFAATKLGMCTTMWHALVGHGRKMRWRPKWPVSMGPGESMVYIALLQYMKGQQRRLLVAARAVFRRRNHDGGLDDRRRHPER